MIIGPLPEFWKECPVQLLQFCKKLLLAIAHNAEMSGSLQHILLGPSSQTNFGFFLEVRLFLRYILALANG